MNNFGTGLNTSTGSGVKTRAVCKQINANPFILHGLNRVATYCLRKGRKFIHGRFGFCVRISLVALSSFQISQKTRKKIKLGFQVFFCALLEFAQSIKVHPLYDFAMFNVFALGLI